jgi:transcriptional regulator with XRE-family HTH domain
MRSPTTRSSALATEARIGEVLKHAREGSGLSLRTLGMRAGFSASFLSQVENGQVSPSIASLEKICAALGLTLPGLFEESQAQTPVVVRAESRPGFNSSWSRARVESLSPASDRRSLAAIAVTLSPGGISGKHHTRHPADQFAYVLTGKLVLFLGDDRIELQEGDSVLIPSKSPHRWHNERDVSAQVLLVSSRIAP